MSGLALLPFWHNENTESFDGERSLLAEVFFSFSSCFIVKNKLLSFLVVQLVFGSGLGVFILEQVQCICNFIEFLNVII